MIGTCFNDDSTDDSSSLLVNCVDNIFVNNNIFVHNIFFVMLTVNKKCYKK